MNALGFNEQDADAAAAIAAAAVMAAPPPAAAPAPSDSQQQGHSQQQQQQGDAAAAAHAHQLDGSSAVPAPETYEAAQRREEQQQQQQQNQQPNLDVEDPNSFVAAAAAAAAGAGASTDPSTQGMGTANRSNAAGKRKRGGNYPVRTKAKRATRPPDRMKKITRSRKVNSCLQCRLKKQKCDRQHPVCGNCQLQIQGKNGAIKGDEVECQWIDAPLPDKPSLSAEDLGTLHSQVILDASGAITEAAKAPQPGHQSLVKMAYQISRDPNRDFPTRVKAARSAVVGWILATNNLSLPDPKRALDLMDIYERHVAWYCAIVLPCVWTFFSLFKQLD